jgi:hypothetical protein
VEEASRAAQYQIDRLKNPEFLAVKQEEDERFREQSFGACLSVICLLILVATVSGVLIVAAHRSRMTPPHVVQRFATGPPAPDSSSLSMLPPRLGDLERGQVGTILQPTGNVPILHARFGNDILLYALPATGASPQSLASFRLAISAIDSQTDPPLVSQEVRGKRAYYAIIGANGGLVGDVTQRLVNLNM